MPGDFSFYSILPPVIVLLVGYTTKRIALSLLIGVILAALIATNFSFLPANELVATCLWNNLEFDSFFSINNFWSTWNLFICIFLFLLGIFVCLLQYSGGALAYTAFVAKFINSKKNAETSSLLLSSSLFIDDYLSSLTVGSVMSPITDKYDISRARLALLVDSMAAPLAILCPFSSWVAALIGFLKENGVSNTITSETLINSSPLTTYFYILPFLFYSFILFFAMWYIVRAQIYIGKHSNEKININHSVNTRNNHELKDFFIPVIFLIFGVLGGMLHSGGFVFLSHGDNDFFNALQSSNAAIGLFIGGIITIFSTIVFFTSRKKVPLHVLPVLIYKGIKLMLPAIVVLILAWCLGDILRNQLHTGKYLAETLLGNCNIYFLPFIFFIAASLISFAIGSSWGTASMLFPIAIPMTLAMINLDFTPQVNDVPIILPVLGAVLSGCVAGDHLSPISDTTIMSATSSGTSVIEHVRTQFPFALPIVLITSICYLIPALLIEFNYLLASVISISIGILLSCLTLTLIKNKG